MSKKQDNIRVWVNPGEISGRFAMIPPELFESTSFQNLSHAARAFYLCLVVHKESEYQRGCLIKALREYNNILGLGMTEKDIQDEGTPINKTRYTSGYFVIPLKQLQSYGYSASYASKLKKELIKAGFIKVKYGGKGRFNGWNENITVYQFIGDWKNKNPLS